MKKLTYLFIAIAFFSIISCSGEKSKEEIEQTQEQKICDCDTLTKGEGKFKGNLFTSDQQPFTGICQTKDKYDSVISIKTYDKGFKMSHIKRKRIYGNYYIIKDLKYDVDGNRVSGYTRKFSGDYDSEINGIKNISVSEVQSYENSREKDWYEFTYTKMKDFENNDKDYFFMDLTLIKRNFENVDISKLTPPKCFSKSEIIDTKGTRNMFGEYEEELITPRWRYEEKNLNNIENIMNSLKQELPYFDFIKQ